MASDVFFTTNPAEFTKLEGLYISERNPPGFIRGADTSLVGVSGVTVRGPTTVELITSTGRFLEVYGGRDFGTGGSQPLFNEIWAMLINKPFGSIHVRRITAAAAVAATLEAETLLTGAAVPVLRIPASSTGFKIDFGLGAGGFGGFGGAPTPPSAVVTEKGPIMWTYSGTLATPTDADGDIDLAAALTPIAGANAGDFTLDVPVTPTAAERVFHVSFVTTENASSMTAITAMVNP